MTDPSKPRTLRDYVHFLRRNVWVILACMIVASAAAVAVSLSQPKRYTTTAHMFFPDPLARAGIVGEQASNAPPAQLAAQGVSRLTSDATLQRVKRSINSSLPTSQLKSDISTVTDPNTFGVTVTATASRASTAAKLANAVVDQAKADADAATSRQFGQVAKSFSAQIKGLTPAQRGNQAIVSALYDNYSRARALSNGGAVAAEIQSHAGVPSSPSSPKPVSSGVVGLFLGFILGLIAAGVREAFDTRLRGTRAVEADLRLPILGQVREEALGRSPGSAAGGRRLDDRDLEAFRILRTNVELFAGDKPLRTIAVTSALAEEGKTTVASSLAFTLALAGRRTLLVECDLRRPTLSDRLALPRTPGLTDFLSGEAEPREVVRVVAPTVGQSHNGNGNGNGEAVNGNGASHGPSISTGLLACIPAGRPTERAAELLASPAFHQFLAEVAGAYDIVVIDTPPLLPVADTLQVLPRVDAVLVCLRGSRTTRDQAIAARTAISRVPERPAGVVLTGARDRHDYGSYYGYGHAYGAHSTDKAPAGASSAAR